MQLFTVHYFFNVALNYTLTFAVSQLWDIFSSIFFLFSGGSAVTLVAKINQKQALKYIIDVFAVSRLHLPVVRLLLMETD